TVAPATLDIPTGEIVGSARVTGVAAGSTVVRASASGFNQGTVDVQVTPNTITLSLDGVVVGKNLQVSSSVGLGTAAPAGTPLPVTITSADPTRVLLSTSATAPGRESITLGVAAGASSTSNFYVQALADAGAVRLTANAPGYAPESANVALQPAGFV